MNIAVTNKQRGSDREFLGYGAHVLPVVGVHLRHLEIGGRNCDAKFYVIKGKGKLLIGRITALQILKIGSEVSDGVTELSKFKGIVIDIPKNGNVNPVAQPYRRVQVALEKLVNEKIELPYQQGIAEKVDGPS